MKIAVVGATGLVGSVMLKVLQERGFGNQEIIPAASSKSEGKKIAFSGRELEVVSVEDAVKQHCDYAIFSAGSKVSKEYAPEFAAVGTTVIDNSSCWRMDQTIPLVVPEINIDAVQDNDRIIANPNCSTIQMVLALAPLHRQYGIKRLVISTYQSVTGTGVKAVKQLQTEEANAVHANDNSDVQYPIFDVEMAYPYQIYRNVLPHGGDFLDNDYTTEEMKLVNETRKILSDANIKITATVARVPVTGGHSESVNAEFEKPFEMDEVRRLLSSFPGIILLDNPEANEYPMPILSEGKDGVFVGRLRRDDSTDNALNMWIVSDNLRKGAATNAVQIMQKLIERRNGQMQ
ncbi:MAG: aspartate-semialdehyde dehydrogenase [Bacteroidales bacterium]|nr:aspartate-semialdehyde dehydrogenase [Bacteroidales bacterium]